MEESQTASSVMFEGMGETSHQPARRGERFFHNVLWSWLGVGVSLFSGVVLSPYIIHKLGDEGYGIWALVFALVEYYWLLDLGFRSATLKYSAHYRATGEIKKLNELVNTGLLYFSGVGVLLFAVTLVLSQNVSRLFRISAGYQWTFAVLVIIVGTGWAMGTSFNVFGACLEGFQRFDISNRIWIMTIGVRSIGCAILLAMGYGLIAMGLMVLISQALGYTLNYLAFRRVFPTQRFSIRLARMSVFRQMAGYGIHTFVATVSMQLLNQTAPLLIGHFLPTAFVGYYALPVRLLQYSVDMVGRVGFVTGSSSAEMSAQGDLEAVSKLGIYANRYCLTLFLPLSIFLLIYGWELIQIWIRPEFALHSAPLLPALVAGTTIAIAAQFNSSSILYGLGRHQGYAYGLLVEAILSVPAMYVAIQKYGILGAACVASALMILNRGIYTPWLVCRNLNFSFPRYMGAIFIRPLGVAVPILALALILKRGLFNGSSWVQLLAGLVILGGSYYGLAFFVCLESQHRDMLVSWLMRRLKALRGPSLA